MKKLRPLRNHGYYWISKRNSNEWKIGKYHEDYDAFCAIERRYLLARVICEVDEAEIIKKI